MRYLGKSSRTVRNKNKELNKQIMISRLKSYLFFTCLLILLIPVQDVISANKEEQQVIPFIGMVLEYQFDVSTTEKEGNSTIIVPMLVNWTIYYELYNESNTDIFISNLILQVSVLSLVPLDEEIGYIVENISSREVYNVDVDETLILNQLYSTYYSPYSPNYTPFYINSTNIVLGQDINIYNYTMAVVSQERVPVALRDIDLGYRDAYLIEYHQKLSHVEHTISLLYEIESGLLIAGRLFTVWQWGDYYLVYKIDAKLYLKRTNALTEKAFAVNINDYFIYGIASFPIIALVIKIFRMKEVKGGL